MTKPSQRAEVNTFIQGLITEASPLNFPPNASKQEENFETFRDGTRKRRLGLDYVDGYTLRTISNSGSPQITNPVFNGFVWEDAGGFLDNTFIVAQVGNLLEFFDEDFTFIQSYQVFPDNRGNYEYSFASVEGRLIVLTSAMTPTNTDGQTPLLVTYNGPTGSPRFSFGNVQLKIRDFWGVDTGDANLEDDIYYRVSTLFAPQVYNLNNQSWAIPRKDSAGILQNPLTMYSTAYIKYPSNSEVVWTGLQFQPIDVPNPPFERVYPNLYEEVFGLTPIASKGFFIIDALSRGGSRTTEFTKTWNNNGMVGFPPSAIAGLVNDITKGGPTVAAGFAGRAWYAGFSGDIIDGDGRSPKLNSHILFSQLIKNSRDLGKCYQEGDPTSREGADVVDTDGGYIKIAEMDKVYSLKPLGNSLVVIANNGVWAITGGNEFGFSATNYKVGQISTYGCTAKNSVILQGDTIMYWGDGGIYVVAPDKTTGNLVVNNVSRTTIQTLFDAIPSDAIPSVKGAYDDKKKKLRWVYKTGTKYSSNSDTRELIFDFDLGTFSMNSIKNAPDNTVEIEVPLFFNEETIYLTSKKTGGVNNQYTFSNYKDTNFLDWKTNDGVGVDAKAFVLTGSQIAGDSAVFKQVPYLVLHMLRTETETDSDGVPLNQSGCLFRIQWDWATNTVSNKIGQLQQGYRYRKAFLPGPNASMDTGFETVVTRSKLRGRGRSLALYMETEPNKDCHILGWNLTLNGNQVA